MIAPGTVAAPRISALEQRLDKLEHISKRYDDLTATPAKEWSENDLAEMDHLSAVMRKLEGEVRYLIEEIEP